VQEGHPDVAFLPEPYCGGIVARDDVLIQGPDILPLRKRQSDALHELRIYVVLGGIQLQRYSLRIVVGRVDVCAGDGIEVE
jgi:hypothetical protein